VNLTGVHYLSGPVSVQGAEPGDCLVVDILDGMTVICVMQEWLAYYILPVTPFEKMPWGYTVHSAPNISACDAN
jgi:formamidase